MRHLRLLALFVLMPGCYDGQEKVSLSEQARLVAEAACAGAFACDCDNAFTDDYADEAECVTEVQEMLVDRASDDVGLSFNEGCVERVAWALGRYDCQGSDEARVSTELFAAAEQLRECRLFIGSAGDGEACERLGGGLGDSCDAGHFCNEGVCVVAGGGAFEETCESDADCQQSYRCRTVEEEMQMRCLAQPEVSEACSMSGDCAPGAYCTSADTCAALPVAGQACAPSPSQTGLVCAPGSACANAVCEAGASMGMACGVTCGAGLTCEGGFCVAIEAAVCAYELDAV